jgi:RNA polymerase sigma-70 factor (ECF subfamily)
MEAIVERPRILAAQGGDASRFEALYREHYAAVLAYARRRIPGRADDVVSETFLVAWRRLDDVPSDGLPWLYGVARRVVADVRRSAGRQQALAERLAEVHVPAVETV